MEIRINELEHYGKVGRLLKKMIVVEKIEHRYGVDYYCFYMKCPLCRHVSKEMIAVNGVFYEADFAGGLKIHLFKRHGFKWFFKTWKDFPSGKIAWKCKVCGLQFIGVLHMLLHHLEHTPEEIKQYLAEQLKEVKHPTPVKEANDLYRFLRPLEAEVIR